jgi:hypothetical protein
VRTDHRLILDGDLQTTNKIIQSIEDKGQMRYLHITLSFQESEISAETLNAVTQEYKTLFMNAYHEDEYCFYAEAHLPKIKNLVDKRTGEPVERKPHIHIVIPRTNLVTEKSLNPVGDLTNTKTQEQLDAIQEHINNKYNLSAQKMRCASAIIIMLTCCHGQRATFLMSVTAMLNAMFMPVLKVKIFAHSVILKRCYQSMAKLKHAMQVRPESIYL